MTKRLKPKERIYRHAIPATRPAFDSLSLPTDIASAAASFPKIGNHWRFDLLIRRRLFHEPFINASMIRDIPREDP
jgi:hypothetical protein